MSKNLKVAELDFDTIKANLKEFFASKPEFTDYNYEGSGLSILIDALAYNTHYNAMIANMLVPEMFLDTAVKKETVALHAKRLGYLPRSYRCARSFINIEVFPNNSPEVITLDKNTNFTNSGSIQYSFFNQDDYSIQPDVDGRYIFTDVPIYQGTLMSFSYSVGSTPPYKFQIPALNADISLLRVVVQESSINTDQTVYRYYDNIASVDSDSNVYFLRINENGYYEVYFGDDVIGKNVQTGNVIILEYPICNGSDANGATGFTINGSISGYNSIAVATQSRAFGGAFAESIPEIKENAYKRLLSQNRAVSDSDYKSIVNSIIPIGDAAVWGGENNDPPVYGKVFMSLVPLDINTAFDTATKQWILDNLRSKMTVTVKPVIVDPDYTYIEINTGVYYDSDKTSLSKDQIKTLVLTQIADYTEQNLNKFGRNLKHSQLVADIDDTDKSITSNVTKFVLKKELKPTLNILSSYTINFKNPIRQSTDVNPYLQSTTFYVSGVSTPVFMDERSGVIRLCTIINGVKSVVRNIGSIDYNKGLLTIDPIVINRINNTNLYIRLVPLSSDVISTNNTILVVNNSDVSVTVIPEAKNKLEYVFTSS